MASSDRTGLAESIVRCADGDEGAFAVVFDTASARVHGLVLRVLRDSAMAEEVTQEVFLEIWRKSPTFDATASGWGWVLAIAHRRAVDAVRSSQASRNREAIYVQENDNDTVPGPEGAVILDADRQAVRTCLDTLTATQRPAIELAYWQGLTHAQVADHLGAALGTVKSRIRDGLRKLATCLEPMMRGDDDE